ncbi:MAG: protein phosphatase 2C domain-containing protein, partial [Cyanobium sp.]
MVIACSVIASSVIGAAHRRQGRPCQDAALSRELLSTRGERLLLLAVADGHGGSRYWLSHVGSQLACELAATAVAAALAD